MVPHARIRTLVDDPNDVRNERESEGRGKVVVDLTRS